MKPKMAKGAPLSSLTSTNLAAGEAWVSLFGSYLLYKREKEEWVDR
jgi:hypothetical protein